MPYKVLVATVYLHASGAGHLGAPLEPNQSASPQSFSKNQSDPIGP